MSGVLVPEMKDKIPGLLFADSANMNVNNKKCGIMAINCSTDTTFKIRNQLIPIQKNDKLQIFKWIADTEAGTSCNWMGLKLVYPELKTHINYVFIILNKTYWAAGRYANSGFIEKRFIEERPFCRNIAPETIEHMLLECSLWQALRADMLAQYINIYRTQVATKPPLLPASISMRLVGKLLGEELKLESTRIRKDPSVLCVKTTLETAKFLNAIALPRYLMLNIKWIPGLLFADNVAALAESSDGLQIALNP
ncbi:hypothetical protein BB561_006886 [Smittium simulii]|uniref:Uncharacterized protein n=1 Tax=Smittium simulii TaxID=133385 RepID=A0A2T9Y0K5_9FUNG|nr:hypothetical protein BB561_006886 [Smittium simulii]